LSPSRAISWCLGVLAIVSATALAEGGDPAWYERKDTWQGTMAASRAALAKHSAAAAGQQAGGVTLGPWYATAGLKAPKGLATVLFPERGDDPLAKPPGAKSPFRKRPAWRDGTIVHLGGGAGTVVYAFREIVSDKPRALAAYLGSDDWMKVFLNGRAIHTCTKRHGVRPNEHTIQLPLRKGVNKLLVKVHDVGGVHAMYFSTAPKPVGSAGSDEAALWVLVRRDFPGAGPRRQMAWEQADRIWSVLWDERFVSRLAGQYARRVGGREKARAAKLAEAARTPADLAPVRELYYRGKELAATARRVGSVNVPALRRAIEDLTDTFPKRYGNGGRYLRRLDELGKVLPALAKGVEAGEPEALKRARELIDLRREALLANPLLDFDRMLLVRRSESSPRLGLVANWESNSSLPKTGHDNEIAVLSDFRGTGRLTTLLAGEGKRFVGDVDLHWDADRLLLSMPGANGRWQIHELALDRTAGACKAGPLRELPLINQKDVDNYDACYLPDGRVLFTSTAPFVGVPCVTGSSHVSNIYLYDPAAPSIRRLTFEQDHDWCPTVLNNGRVLYLRWEYSDIPHYVSRILFHMNPDGTGQMEYYGSNSYWPNSTFFARPCPNHPTRFVGIVSGHHDVPRMGELILFDVATGRREADGVVQRIPGWGKRVEPTIRDGLVRASWPKFLHPWPLSDKYFLVSAKPTSRAPWGIYLADVFDNMLLLAAEPGYALMEPIPLKKTPAPPIIPDRAKPDQRDAVVYLSDVYVGDGLRGVPRGTVKKLRLFTYQFAYHGMGGQINRVGLDGPWDVKRIIGTVPVEADGSAYFRIPANTPIAVQPLDAEGKALQLMRSWMTAMGGEVLACVGCHEPQDAASPNRQAIASTKPPAEITPWYGPMRGFSFRREVQGVLDHHCTRCHNGKARPDGKVLPDLTDRPEVHPRAKSGGYNRGTKFSPSYIALRSYVRGHTIESDIHMLSPCEFHADTTRLVQRLRKGHHGVRLDGEAWDRIITWLDLNTPYHGTWHEIVGWGKVKNQRDRRQAMNTLYAAIDEDPEAIYPVRYRPGKPGKQARPSTRPVVGETSAPGWPFGPAEAKRRQKALGPVSDVVELGSRVKMTLVRVPAGEFVMGSRAGHADERPRTRVRIAKPFWMGKVEVTNEQFACFDAAHDSRIEHGDFLQFSTRERGYVVSKANQPVCRVSWHEAMAFCRWLSERTGRTFTLPAEAQWEWACRAGTDGEMSYGPVGGDFSAFANLADHCLRSMDTFGWGLPSGAVPPWRPAVEGVNDKHRVSAPVGTFQPNAWGLCDMHGNVAEWTRSDYRPYPYRASNGRAGPGRKVVRGGSWYDRPRRARSAFRSNYRPYQGVYDVGFRVVCDSADEVARRGAK